MEFLNMIKKWLTKKTVDELKPVETVKKKRPVHNNFDFDVAYENYIASHIRRSAQDDIIKMPGTQDAAINSPSIAQYSSVVPDSILSWYGKQGFFGWQTCAILSQHWLIRKCCNLPARDAIRNDYTITVNDGTEVSDEILDDLKNYDITFEVMKNLEDFVTTGKIFGIRVCVFLVDSDDPKYYQKPFNIDGVKPGSYKGMVQIDPYWCTPMLDMDAGGDPLSQNFYEPTWWVVKGIQIHASHIRIFRGDTVPDILKPTYIYGGVPVPQQIYERVYCAERTANEAPQLSLTKRLITYKTDVESFLANQADAEAQLQVFTQWMNNYSVKVIDTNDEIDTKDVSLADLDTVIMTQYQLVAAAAKIPATKLLGTTPKGFSATGEYDEASYHEELESIQNSDLTPLLERHHALVIKSEIEPKYGISFTTTVTWSPLDSPTAKEQAELNKLKADTDAVLATVGAIDGADIRKRIINDPDSGYNGIDSEMEYGPLSSDPEGEYKIDLFGDNDNDDKEEKNSSFEI